MRPRFHIVGNELFSARISGDAPSETDRKKFKLPNLERGMLSQPDIYSQLVRGDALQLLHSDM